MRRIVLPAGKLFAWAKLNGVDFTRVDVKTDIKSNDGALKGAGLVSRSDFDANGNGTILMSAPIDLILSLEQVERYAAIDKHLKLVLDTAGVFGRTARGAILIFLLIQITNTSPDFDGPVSFMNPHTDYVNMLPENVLLPTFYTDEEKDLLFGTSLQDALDQKLRSLEKEFNQLREYTQDISWCQKYWWDDEDGKLAFEDWMLVDALYRSRALDLPGSGHAMIPCIDMANHASNTETVALYETDEDGRAVLQVRPGRKLTKAEEVTITYGDEKGACEMVFSYGFLEAQMSSAKMIFLDLDIPDDDPLRLAKKTANKEAPGVRLFVASDGNLDWEGGYIWWACVNEEDGLNFRVAQENDGNQQLEVLWRDQRIDASQLSNVLRDDHNWDIFRLRAVVILQERVDLQVSYLEASSESYSQGQGQSGIRDTVWALIGRLRALEGGLLSMFHGVLELQKIELLSSEIVKRYLSAAQEDVESGISAEDHEDDFS